MNQHSKSNSHPHKAEITGLKVILSIGFKSSEKTIKAHGKILSGCFDRLLFNCLEFR
jgi:hypothetical protein